MGFRTTVQGIILAQNLAFLPQSTIFGLMDAKLNNRIMQDARNELNIIQFALDSTDDIVWLWDIESDSVYFYGNTDLFLNLTINTHSSTMASWSSKVHPDDKQEMKQAITDLLKNDKKKLVHTFRLSNNENKWVWLKSIARVYEFDKSGRAKSVVGFIFFIDEFKKSEETLKVRDEQLAFAMLGTKSSLFDYDITSNTFRQLTYEESSAGATTVERKGSITDGLKTVHPDDHESNINFFDNFTHASKNKDLIEAKWRSNYLSNEFRWQKVQGRAVTFDDQGNPTRAVGIRQDIHDTYTIEHEALAIQERNHSALKNTYHGIWEWNIKTGEFYINENIIELLIKNVQDWPSTMDYWFSLVHPDDQQRISAEFSKKLKSNNKELITQYRIKAIDGSIVWLASSGTIVERDEQSKPLRALGTIIDITRQKEVEIALEQEKRMAQKTLESINEAVITTDQNGSISMINPKAEKLFQATKAVAIGLTLSELCSLKDEESNTVAQDPVALCLKTQLSFNLGQLTLTNNNNKLAYIDCSVSPLKDAEKQLLGCVMVIRDVTHSRKMSHEMEHRAQHDALTNLYNRHTFDTALENSISEKDYQHILCYIDLDQFKIVNDTCGHIAGDELLRQLSNELSNNIRKEDILARLGGDEFGILIKNCDVDSAFRIANEIKKSIVEYTFHWEDKTFKLGASIGLAEINPGTAPSKAMQHADAACFSAKEQGRNRVHVYRPDDDEMTMAKGQMGWVPRIQQALENDHFELYVQAIVDLQETSEIPSHYEILIRLFENGEVIPPGGFLPAAERYNLSTQLDKWVIKNTLKILSEFEGGLTKKDKFNINLSAASLTENGFLEFIQQSLLSSKIHPSQICFEITETAAVTNLTAANVFINTLKDMGCEFALDDFGSGLSSFGYLKNFPVDYLKIDGAFVKDIASDPIDAAMVKSINEIGQIMGKKTVAEWVENQTIADMLKDIGVNYAQGYHFSKPSPLSEMLKKRTGINSHL